jgi:beta-lactamase class A
MARTLQAVALGSALPSSQRESLQTWLRNCRTGAKRIRAAVPAGWEVGDKTGTGDYGTANDIAVIWAPSRKPIILAVYHTQGDAMAKSSDDVVAAAARIAIDIFARGALGGA